MCGIVGWVDFKEDLSQQHKIIETMTDTLSARGPDAAGTWQSDHALLGHRRLCVVDPAGGSQPMIRCFGDHKYIIVYNGELYNTNEIRKELESRGYFFRSNSDTEVLLLSYIEWKSKCVDRLNGIFAFGVWDEADQSLFLARDRFGVKPLFYTLCGDAFLFSSELKALLDHPSVNPRVDTEGLSEIFALGPSRTPGHGIFKGINEVKPAHSLVYNHCGMKLFKYWALESHPHTENMNNTVLKVRELVQDTIVRQLISDVPICTFLSGGLDSSAITALAANHFKNSGLGQLHTYSIDYLDNDLYFKSSTFQPNSDAPWVKRMSEEFGTLHHSITIDTPQLISALEDAVIAKDLPGMADIDSSLWLFCREIKKNHVVALSGECATL